MSDITLDANSYPLVYSYSVVDLITDKAMQISPHALTLQSSVVGFGHDMIVGIDSKALSFSGSDVGFGLDAVVGLDSYTVGLTFGQVELQGPLSASSYPLTLQPSGLDLRHNQLSHATYALNLTAAAVSFAFDIVAQAAFHALTLTAAAVDLIADVAMQVSSHALSLVAAPINLTRYKKYLVYLETPGEYYISGHTGRVVIVNETFDAFEETFE